LRAPDFRPPERVRILRAVKCSARGCSFENDEFVRPASADLKPYCQYHATGHAALVDRDMFWRPTCSCGSYADGFELTRNGVLERHTLRTCSLKVLALAAS